VFTRSTLKIPRPVEKDVENPNLDAFYSLIAVHFERFNHSLVDIKNI
jgi:hypothetical protein